MTCTERIVIALRTLGKAGKATGFSEIYELFPSARYKLVNIGLMTDVKDNMIIRRIKDCMNSKCQLHNTEVRCQVTTILLCSIYKKLPDFLAKLGNFGFIQFF